MKLERSLATIGRRLIGGFGTRKTKEAYGSNPHQGAKEIARRQKQAAKIAARKAGE
jgi:hypothetical protein